MRYLLIMLTLSSCVIVMHTPEPDTFDDCFLEYVKTREAEHAAEAMER